MKVRGNKGAVQKYDSGQLMKYGNLASYAMRVLGFQEVCHLILAPRRGANLFLHRNRWIQDIDPHTGRVALRLEGLATAARKTKWRELPGDPARWNSLRDVLEKMPVVVRHYDELTIPTTADGDATRLRAWQVQIERIVQDSEPAL